jgi:hypothetical protein
MGKPVSDIMRLMAISRNKANEKAKKKSKAPAKKEAPAVPITEFDNVEDWMMTTILVSIMHANPGIAPEKAVEIGKAFVKKLHMPNTAHLWRRQVDRIDRTGIRAAASRIRRELFKLI